MKKLETGDDKFWKPRFLNTLGWIRAQTGDVAEALKLNREALQLALPTGDPETIHNAQINVGENYLQLGDLKNAQKVLVDVHNRIKGKRHLYAGWRYKTRLLIALAELYEKRGGHPKALYFINQALKAVRKNGAQKHEATALRVKACIVHKNRPETAFAYLEQARELSAKIGARPLHKKISDTIKALEHPLTVEQPVTVKQKRFPIDFAHQNHILHHQKILAEKILENENLWKTYKILETIGILISTRWASRASGIPLRFWTRTWGSSRP